MAENRILKPYVRRRDPGLFTRILLALGLLAVAAFYGLMCAILPARVVVIPAVPIFLMIGLILWMLPDIGGMREAFYAKAIVLFVGLNVLWPNYVVISLPGLPWITPTRIVVFGALAMFVVNLATSAQLRQTLVESMRKLPVIYRLFWGFWAITVVAVLISTDHLQSINKFFNNQIYWTMMFALCCWLGFSRGLPVRIGRVMAWTIILVALATFYEHRYGTAFWINRLPWPLQIDRDFLERLGSINGRLGSDIPRVRGTFSGALYYGEYLAISFPFVIHAMVTARRFWHVVLLGAGALAVATSVVFTDSRSAMLGMILTLLGYAFMAACRFRVQKPESIAANASLYSFPLVAALVGALIIFWRRLHVMVIGGGQHKASSETRGVQWEMGLQKIIANPFGYGVGRSGDTLGYYNPGSDSPTVDSYYLTLMLEYGVLGFVAFVALFVAAIWYGFTGYLKARSDDMLMLAPFTIAMGNFIVIKSVASTEVHLPILMIIMGCTVGMIARQRADAGAAVPMRQIAGRRDWSAFPAAA